MANIFVDQSATHNGNGTTAAQAASDGATGAYNTFESVSPASGDVVWIRRTSTLKLLTAAKTLSLTNGVYIGWPQSSDPDYSTRPASGTSNGWDADVVQQAEIKTTTVLSSSFLIITGGGTRMERILARAAFTSTTDKAAAIEIQANASLNNCYGLNESATTGSVISYGILVSNAGVVVKITNSSAELIGALTGSGACAAFAVNAGSDVELANVNYYVSSGSATNPNARCFIVNATGQVTLSIADGEAVRVVSTATCPMMDFQSAVAGSSIAIYHLAKTDYSASYLASSMSTPSAAGRFLAQRLIQSQGCRVLINGSGQYVHYEEYAQTVASNTYTIEFAGAGNMFVANNFSETSGNTLGAINGTYANWLFLQNTDFASGAPFGSVNSMKANVWIADSGGTYGNWRFQSARGVVTAQAVARADGETYSLKFDMNAGLQNFLGFLPVTLNALETILAGVTASNTKITIYGAYKGYTTAPDASQIWADCDYVDDATGAHRAFASSRQSPGVALTSDSSSWSGDTGLTAFKLELTIAALQSCVVPIRIFDNLRQASAYFYIDPKPVVS